MSGNGKPPMVKADETTMHNHPTKPLPSIDPTHTTPRKPADATDQAPNRPPGTGDDQGAKNARAEGLRDVVKNCTRAILRSYDQQAILDETCRMLVRSAGYNMSWVGRWDADGTLIPLAQSGLPADFEASPSMNGHDPVRRTRDEDRPALLRGIPESPDPSLRTHARQHGYASHCALPLSLKGSKAVLSVYCAQDDAFDEQEVALLQELAADLERGIGLLHELGRLERANAQKPVAGEVAPGAPDATDAVFMASKGGRIIHASPAFARMMGYKDPDEMQGKNNPSLYTIMNPMDKNRIMDCLDSGSIVPVETELRRRDASSAWALIVPQRLETASGPVVRALVVDLSAAQDERQGLQELSALSHTTDLAIIRMDLDGVIQGWNPGATRLYGFQRDEAIGRTPDRLHSDNPQSMEEKRILDAVRKGLRVPPYETRRRNKDQTPIDVCINVEPIPGPAGHPIGIWTLEHEAVHTAHRTPSSPQPNITIPPSTPSASLHANVQATDPPAQAQIDEDALHEVKNALTAMLNNVELLALDREGPKKREHLAAIRRNGHQVAQLLRQRWATRPERTPAEPPNTDRTSDPQNRHHKTPRVQEAKMATEARGSRSTTKGKENGDHPRTSRDPHAEQTPDPTEGHIVRRRPALNRPDV